jgi:hypothetical protein
MDKRPHIGYSDPIGVKGSSSKKWKKKMCKVCDNNEKVFKKMMGIEINGWTWDFHSALPYVSDLVVSGQVVLDKDVNTQKIANELATDKYESESIYLLLDLFIAFCKPETELDLDFLGISEEAMREFKFIPMDIEGVCEGNPVKVARLLAEAQKEFIPTYSKENA